MPKQWTSALAKLLPKPAKPPFTRWPRISPSHEPSFRTSRRSQLRFTPRAAGAIEQGIIRRLMIAQSLLEKGQNESALTFCHNELSEAPPRGRHDFFHRAISLFTRHRDFEAATSLCNRMVEEGYVLSKKTHMVMMRGMRSHSAKQAHEVLDSLLRGGSKLDDLAFKAVLDMMTLHQHPPEDLDAALEVYSKTRRPGWKPQSSIIGTIIQSYSLAGRWDDAEHRLDSYRTAQSHRILKVDTRSRPGSAKEVTSRQSGQHDPHSQLRRRSGILLSTEDPLYPYAAVLVGYTKSAKPVPTRIQRLLAHLKIDGLSPDIQMFNMIIHALVGWGMTRQAFRMFHLLLRPSAIPLPDAYTFRHLFVALNPKRPRGPHGRRPPNDVSARALLHEMITVVRWRLHRRKPQPHKNIISTATFNSALGTYCAQNDYAAAWTVLALFPRYHLVPDTQTSRIVVLSLLRRMRTEVSEANMGEVIWMDRFIGQHRSTMLDMANKMMMADRLFLIGHTAVTEMKERKYQTYLKPSMAILGSALNELEFLVALLRTSLQASLGFARHTTSQLVPAESAISAAMYGARADMIPRGRSERN